MAQRLGMHNYEAGREMEAMAYEFIGFFEVRTKEHYKEGVKHYRKAINIYRSSGDVSAEIEAQTTLASIQSPSMAGADLNDIRDLYREHVQSEGEQGRHALVIGTELANALIQAGHRVEGERLLSKLAAISLQVYGAEHDLSKMIAMMLKLSTQRYVEIQSQPGVTVEALQYDAIRDQYVVVKDRETEVHGAALQQTKMGKTFTVAANDVIIDEKTPVICRGLINAAHLNGKIGDLGEYNSDTGRHQVYFEDKSLKPAMVKTENLRIVCELPAVDEESERAQKTTDEATASLADLNLGDMKSDDTKQQKGKKKRGKKKGRK